MKRSDWMILGLVGVMAMWAMALLAQPLLPKPESTGLKVVELVIAAASSFGTMVAAMVALYFGLGESRRRQAAERQRAVLAAVRLEGRVDRLALLTSNVKTTITVGRLPRPKYERALKMLGSEHIPPEVLQFEDDQLLDLVALLPDAPGKLTHHLEAMKTASFQMLHHMNVELFGTMEQETQVEMIEAWAKVYVCAAEAFREISNALKEVRSREVQAWNRSGRV